MNVTKEEYEKIIKLMKSKSCLKSSRENMERIRKTMAAE